MTALLVGGLVIFLFAIQQLSVVLESMFSREAEDVIRRYTKNLFSGILVGTLATILLDSSSAVIILTIVLVNAKVLDLKRTIGIVMGANVGTTVSSQIIALQVSEYLVYAMVVGLTIQLFAKSDLWKNRGKVLLFLGMLFFGLYVLEESVSPLRESQVFDNWMRASSESPLIGAGIGGLVTLIVQSSSATVGMAIILAKKNLITLASGVAIMMGAELGTCSDTLLATIKGSRAAIKTGIFHLVFNLVSVCLGLLLFAPFIDLIEWLSLGQLERDLANAHVIFNILGVLLFLPLVKPVVQWLDAVLEDKPSPAA